MHQKCSSPGCSWPLVAKGRCARCYAKWNQRRKREDPETRQRLNEVTNFRSSGWTAEATRAAKAAQGCSCALCARPFTEDPRSMQRDHYETRDGARVRPVRNARGAGKLTKHPRALLCPACNCGLSAYEWENGQRAAGMRISQYEDYIAKYGG